MSNRNQGQLIVGLLIILVGLLFLFEAVFDIDLGSFCWPVGLILLGIFLILRPRMVSEGTRMTQKILGDVRRSGPWNVADEEIWLLIGDLDLDMTQAEIPTGETKLRFFGLIGDVDLLVPRDVGVSVLSTALLTDAKVLGEKRESLVTSVEAASANYETAERKIRLETTALVTDLTVRQA